MSEDTGKPVWSLWRWLLPWLFLWMLRGTVFAVLLLLIFFVGFLLIASGINSASSGDVEITLAVIAMGCVGLLFIVWRWWRWFFRKVASSYFPDSFIACLLPFFIPVWYVLAVGAVFFFFALGMDTLFIALFPYFLILIPVAMIGGAVQVLGCAVLIAGLTALAGMIALAWCARSATGRAWGSVMLLAITATLTLIYAVAYGQYRTRVLKQDRTAQIVRDEKKAKYEINGWGFRDETDLSAYVPFSPSNKLVTIESPELCITNDPPRLHGALALYPVYAAAAQAIYQHESTNDYTRLVQGGTSPEAINALLAVDERRMFDMAFMLYPSEKQLALARGKGKTLKITKIGREAFVFFVSHVNPVDNLTSAQIRDIYGKRVTNWSALGGKDERILPFQRPEGSGSQTAMERFMGDAPLAKPVQEEFQEMMGGIVNRVADYRNYGNAIGFSFRYYVEGMFKHDGVKLLTVDGIAPTAENIRNGAYPLVADVVIVTAGSTNPNVKKLTDWFLSPKGQELLEKVGYVPLQGEP